MATRCCGNGPTGASFRILAVLIIITYTHVHAYRESHTDSNTNTNVYADSKRNSDILRNGDANRHTLSNGNQQSYSHTHSNHHPNTPVARMEPATRTVLGFPIRNLMDGDIWQHHTASITERHTHGVCTFPGRLHSGWASNRLAPRPGAPDHPSRRGGRLRCPLLHISKPGTAKT